MPDLAGLVQLLEGFYQGLHFGVCVAPVHFGLGAPDVKVIGLHETQACIDVAGLGLDVAEVRVPRAKVVDISADVHFVAPSLKGHPVAQTLSSGGDVQVVDAGVDAGTHDLGAVLGDVIGHFFFGEMVPVPAGVAVLPVPAETDLGNHQVRFGISDDFFDTDLLTDCRSDRTAAISIP